MEVFYCTGTWDDTQEGDQKCIGGELARVPVAPAFQDGYAVPMGTGGVVLGSAALIGPGGLAKSGSKTTNNTSSDGGEQSQGQVQGQQQKASASSSAVNSNRVDLRTQSKHGRR